MPRIEQVVAVWGLAVSWVDLGDCDIIMFVSLLLCCLCRLGCVGYLLERDRCVLEIRTTTAEQNTADTMRTVRNIADKCGQMRKIADKSRTNANMRGNKTFDWKGKIVYLLVTLDTTKKIQSCMIDTYVIPKYT